MLPRRAVCWLASAQGPLHDVLIGAPVPQAAHRRAEEHAQPGEIAVEVPGHAAGASFDRLPGPLHARRNQRLPQVEHVRPANLPQLGPAAQLDQPVGRQQGRADDENDGLHGVVVGHGPHSAQAGVQAGQHEHEHRADPKAVDRESRRRDKWISGSRVRNTTPPAKMPTAIFETMNVTSDTIEST